MFCHLMVKMNFEERRYIEISLYTLISLLMHVLGTTSHIARVISLKLP